jgi:hypothetical protein
MSRSTPQIRGLAKRLVVSETLGNKSSEVAETPAFPVIGELRPHLATLVGNGGFRALLARALALAQAEVPWLGAVRVNPEGILEGWEATRSALDDAELLEGRIVLVAQLLGLLIAFIGPSLTSRLVGEIWPQIPVEDGDLRQGGET